MPTSRNRFLIMGSLAVATLASATCRSQGSGPDSETMLAIALAQAKTAMAERDTLLEDILETTRFINVINDDLATVRGLKPGKSLVIPGESGRIPVATYRANLLGRIQSLTTRVNESEERLKQSRRRAEGRVADPKLLAQLAAYERNLEEFRVTIERQRMEIGSLTAQVKGLRADNERLAVAQATAAESLMTVMEEQGTAYYIAGTTEQLLELGVITQVGGGGGFLGIGKRPKVYSPGRELYTSDFTALSVVQDLDIVLPRADRAYRVVSSQNTAYLVSPPDKEGRIRGRIRITDPAQFWASSRFLILLEEK